jgi:hypothetical protein
LVLSWSGRVEDGAITIIALLAAVHVRGLGPGRTVQAVLTVIKVAALVWFVIAGVALGGPTVAPASAYGSVTPSAILLAMIPVKFVAAQDRIGLTRAITHRYVLNGVAHKHNRLVVG